MRQGCHDTLEALHTEPTKMKLLQIKIKFAQLIKVSIQTIRYLHLKIQFLAWKNMTVVQSTNCATHGDAVP